MVQAAEPAKKVLPTVDRVCTALCALLPPGVVVQNVTLKEREAVISGTTTTNSQLSNYMRALEDSSDFERPNLHVVEAAGYTGSYSYRLSVEIECLGQASPVARSICSGSPAAKSGSSTYKCRIDGVLTFQATPCPPGKDG